MISFGFKVIFCIEKQFPRVLSWSHYSIWIVDEMDMTPLQVRYSWGKFPTQTQSGTPSTIIYARWSSWAWETWMSCFYGFTVYIAILSYHNYMIYTPRPNDVYNNWWLFGSEPWSEPMPALIGPLVTNLIKIWIRIQQSLSFAKLWTFCLGLKVLKQHVTFRRLSWKPPASLMCVCLHVSAWVNGITWHNRWASLSQRKCSFVAILRKWRRKWTDFHWLMSPPQVTNERRELDRYPLHIILS